MILTVMTIIIFANKSVWPETCWTTCLYYNHQTPSQTPMKIDMIRNFLSFHVNKFSSNSYKLGCYMEFSKLEWNWHSITVTAENTKYVVLSVVGRGVNQLLVLDSVFVAVNANIIRSVAFPFTGNQMLFSESCFIQWPL